jgi:hypothetical protein
MSFVGPGSQSAGKYPVTGIACDGAKAKRSNCDGASACYVDADEFVERDLLCALRDARDRASNPSRSSHCARCDETPSEADRRVEVGR